MVIAEDIEVFVYDTQAIEREEDDPLKAVIYFHPRSLTSEKVLMTAGQLAGMVHYLKIAFGEEASSFALELGNYEVIQDERFLILVGSKSLSKVLIVDIKGHILDCISTLFGSLLNCYIKKERSSSGSNSFKRSLKVFMDHTLSSFVSERRKSFIIDDSISSDLFNWCQKTAKECSEVPYFQGCAILYRSQELFSTLPSHLFRAFMLWQTLLKNFPENLVQTDLPRGVKMILVTRIMVKSPELETTLSDVASSSESNYEATDAVWSVRNTEGGHHSKKRSRSARSRISSKRDFAQMYFHRREIDEMVSVVRRASHKIKFGQNVIQVPPLSSILFIQSIEEAHLMIVLTPEAGFFDQTVGKWLWSAGLSNLPKISVYAKNELCL